MSKVLVTGGLGFIGSHTAVELLAQGHEVVIADNLANTRPEVLDGIEAISGERPAWTEVDLADRAACAAFLADHPHLDGIIHFAAYKAVGESVEKPLDYYHNNLGSLVNLLEFVKSKPDTAFIFSSSCTVYGQAEQLPVKEDAPVQPAESPYGNTKQIGEEVLKDGAHAHGFHAIATTNATSRWKDADQVDESGRRAAGRYDGLAYWRQDWQSDEMTLRKYEISARER